MIPKAYITEWQNTAPWGADEQIEQDLILSRILIDLFQNDFLKEQLVFRGGTALNKLYFPSSVRYSEDIDLVQIHQGPIKPILEVIKEILTSWLGKRTTEQKVGVFHIFHRFSPENFPTMSKKIKIEINTREHFNVLPIINKEFSLKSQWFSGDSLIPTYSLNEMLGTKMRALYQRSKGRDLFDLDWALRHCKTIPYEIILSFKKYMEYQDNRVSQKNYLANVEEKIDDPVFCQDIFNYLRPGIDYDPQEAFKNIKGLIKRI